MPLLLLFNNLLKKLFMAKNPKEEALDLIADGKVRRVTDNKFGTRVRNVDQDPMDVGDVFTIPADYEVLETQINGAGDFIKFILVQMTNKNSGVTRNIRFFPNMLAKSVYPVINGTLGNKVKTKGSAALAYQKYADKGTEGMDEAVKSLVGKPIEIVAKQNFTVREYQTEKEVSANIYTYDFVNP
jgi:hypothetical protein